MAQRQLLALVVGGAQGRVPTTWLCNCSWGSLAPSLGSPPLCAVVGEQRGREGQETACDSWQMRGKSRSAGPGERQEGKEGSRADGEKRRAG